jgi:hypothetical protein
MMKREYAYPCVYYYVPHPEKENEQQIYILFPDLIELGTPAWTVAPDESNVIDYAKENLVNSLEMIIEAGNGFPTPTKSLMDVPINLGVDIGLVDPFLIKVGFVSVFFSIGDKANDHIEELGQVQDSNWVKVNEETNLHDRETEMTVDELFGPTDENSSILSGKIQGNRYIVNSIAGKLIEEISCSTSKLRELYHVIGSKGDPIVLNFGQERFHLNAEQSLQLRLELGIIIEELIRKQKEDGLWKNKS